MEKAEFQAILDHENRHWWYRGRLRIVRQEVERLDLPEGARILDAGCGSGRVLDELARFGDVVGVDLSSTAVAVAWARGHSVAKARVEELPFADSSFDLVTCLDVIEHTPDDLRALRELVRVTRPGGHLLVTVPAYQSLWCAHDVRNEHYRRYRRRGLRDVAGRAGWQIVRDTHFNSLLLPAAAATRLAGRLRREDHGSDLSLTPPWVDSLLELPLRFEAALLANGVTLAAGLSVAALFVRPLPAPPAIAGLRRRPAVQHRAEPASVGAGWQARAQS